MPSVGGGGGLEVGYGYFLGLHNWVAMHDDLVILHWQTCGADGRLTVT